MQENNPNSPSRGGSQGRRRQRSGRRRRFHDRHFQDRNRGRRDENQVALICAICEKEIRETASAIGIPESGNPAHFDCILKRLSETESIAQHEKICYLGKGSFGIVRFQRPGGSVPFVIRKRIQFEVFEDTPQWRKELTQYKSVNPMADKKKREEEQARQEQEKKELQGMLPDGNQAQQNNLPQENT
ncbi:MAG: hypothetical protein EHM28_04895 [Spirochaetaceae bacterium]|nr:MAG: hypothetical protein EHM28_04895 [Spirochaetaceae bacterium]